MTRIKITELSKTETVKPEEMKKITGGGTLTMSGAAVKTSLFNVDPDKFTVAGFEKLHELTRGRETKHWEDGSTGEGSYLVSN